MTKFKEGKTAKHGMMSGLFLVCLTIAFLGWCIVTFSKEYVQTLRCNVTYNSLPKGIKSVSSSDSIVFITFKSKGFGYLKNSFTEKYTTLELSVKDLTRKKGNRNVYSFSKKELSDYIRESDMYGSTFVEIAKPESLTIYMK